MKKKITLLSLSFVALGSSFCIEGAHYLQRTLGVTFTLPRTPILSAARAMPVRYTQTAPETKEVNNDKIAAATQPVPSCPQQLPEDQDAHEQDYNLPSLPTSDKKLPLEESRLFHTSCGELPLKATLVKLATEYVQLKKAEFKDQAEHRKALKALKEKELADRKFLVKEFNMQQTKKELEALKKSQQSLWQTFNKWLADKQEQRAQAALHKQKMQLKKEMVDLGKTLKTMQKLEEVAIKKLKAITESETATVQGIAEAKALLETISKKTKSTTDLFETAAKQFQESHALQKKHYQDDLAAQEKSYNALKDRYAALETKMKETEEPLKSSHTVTKGLIGAVTSFALWQTYCNWELLSRIFS